MYNKLIKGESAGKSMAAELQASLRSAAAQKSEINADLNVKKTEGITRLRWLYTAVQQAAQTGDRTAFENAKEQYAYAYASEQAKHQATKARVQSRENAIDNEVKQAISGAQEQLAAFQASGDDDILDLESARASQRAGEGVQLDALVDGLQIALDVVGLVPGFGEVADGLNALISLMRGNYVDAGLSVASMIPIAGWAATAGKAGKYALEGAGVLGTVAKYGDEGIDAGQAVAKHAGEIANTGEAILKSTDDLVGGAGRVSDDFVEGAGEATDDLIEGAGKVPKYPGNDPLKFPAEGYEWRGHPEKGSWYNPKTREVLRSDIEHVDPVGAHWDYRSPNGTWYRLYPDGHLELK